MLLSVLNFEISLFTFNSILNISNDLFSVKEVQLVLNNPYCSLVTIDSIALNSELYKLSDNERVSCKYITYVPSL